MSTDAQKTLNARLDALAASAKSLHDTLASNPHDASLRTTVRTLLLAAEKCAGIKENLGAGGQHEELDGQGTYLWNTATGMMRDGEGGGGLEEVLVDVRLAAFWMLDCAWGRGAVSVQNWMRMFRVAVKAGRLLCERNLDVHTRAIAVFDRTAKLYGLLSAAEISRTEEEEKALQRTYSDYLIYRLQLAWKQANLALAETLFKKADGHFTKGGQGVDIQAIEKYADVLLRIGKDLFTQNVLDNAITWLKRAYEVIKRVEPDLVQEEAQELRLGVMHSLARACIARRNPQDLRETNQLLDLMQDDWPMRIVVYLLRLDLLEAEGRSAPSDFQTVLKKIIAIVQITDSTLKTILGKVHSLAGKDLSMACECLEDLLVRRILAMDQQEWIEKVFATRLWLALKDPSTTVDTSTASLQSLLDTMEKYLTRPLSPTATHSSQILLWKMSQLLYTQRKFEQCAEWCKLSLHTIFDRSATSNVAKISRRLIACALETRNYEDAKDVYHAMPEPEKSAVNTQFLMFKLALRMDDMQLAEAALDKICVAPSQDYRAIYACVIDAEICQNERVALHALRRILENVDKIPKDAVHLPTLLRCTILLTVAQLDKGDGADSQDLSVSTESICSILELSAQRAKLSRAQRGSQEQVAFTLPELEWFSRNAYNFALRSIDEWCEKISLRLLKACLSFQELYPKDIDLEARTNVYIRTLFCHYLYTCLSVELARAEDSHTTEQEHHYIAVHEHAGTFRRVWREAEDILSEDDKADHLEKYGIMLTLDFEANLHLKHWDALTALISDAETCQNPTVYQHFGDMILRSRAPNRTKFAALRRVLDVLVKNYTSAAKLATFLRCQLQIALVNEPEGVGPLVAQVVHVAKNPRDGERYPQEELHWISATLWNWATDYHRAQDMDSFTRMGGYALTVTALLEFPWAPKYLRTMQANFLAMSSGEEGR